MAKQALIVVDLQNDFVSGSLSLSNCPSKHDGSEIVPLVNDLVDKPTFDLIVFTQDWHTTDHISFVDNAHLRPFHNDCTKSLDEVKVFDEVVFAVGDESRHQVLWPRHCVQESSGAELHPGLVVPPKARIIKKGTNPDVDSYSAFWDNAKLKSTELADLLRGEGITSVYICGIATDVCVKATAIDAIELGFEVYLIEDVCRGVDEKNIQLTLEEVKKRGGKVITSLEVA